jgi:S1-C subfamily serine protease
MSAAFAAFAALAMLVAPFDGDDAAAALARVQVAESARVELIARLTPSVVCIFPKDNRAGGGSGILIDAEGYGLTNFHVVAPLLPSRKGEGGLADGKLYDLEVLGLDPVGDVAMFRLIGDAPFAAATLGDSDALAVGDETLALGNPFLLAEDYTPTVTFGIISGLHRYQPGAGRALVYSDCIQVDASINPGNSGGPLFDLAGRLIGINGRVSIEERGRINVGVGYAISINQVRRFMPALRAGLTTPHASAGFTVADGSGGPAVDRIVDGSRAARAGVQLGDRVELFAGVPIRSANQFLSILGTYPSEWPVDLVLARGDGLRKVSIRLDASPLPRPHSRGPQRSPGADAPDPFAPIGPTGEPNRRAARRALRMFLEATGGHEVMSRLAGLDWSGRRFDMERPGETPVPVDIEEDRPLAGAEREIPWDKPPADIERAIRWALYTADPTRSNPGYRVVACDEVNRRVAVVLERRAGGASYRVGLDDETGDLLSVEFAHGPTGERMRYQYDAVQRAGAIRHFTHRRTMRGDRVIAEEKFDSVIAVEP